MSSNRTIILAGGMASLTAAAAKALADDGYEPTASIRIRNPEPMGYKDFKLDKQPRNRDWEKRAATKRKRR